ncbi:MAG: AtpZ/AtpI family protein [Verrucomicrobiota bacterium]
MKPAAKFQGMGRALGVGSQMVAATGVGAVIGWWLDKMTGWVPLLTCVFFVLGSMAGFISVYRALNHDAEKRS